MGLPSLECGADARFGLDGGRHAQLLLQSQKAGLARHDWILLDNLLNRYTMHIVVISAQHGPRLLNAITPQSGGMAQGLPPATALYTLLPRRREDRVAADLPPIAMVVHPELLRISHYTADINLDARS